MAYGTIKIDTITFTDGGIDKSVAISGLVQNPTFTGNVTVTGTISGNTVRGQTISGVTITGTTAQFTSGTFTSLTGVTVTGTTANFTNNNFTNISGGTHTITSGVFASGTAANPSISFVSDPNSGLYSPGADQVAISTNGTGRLFVDASGTVSITPSNALPLSIARSSDGELFRARRVGGTYNPGLIISASDTINNEIVFNTAYSLGSAPQYVWQSGSNERMRLDSSGRLGLGTSSAAAPLTVVAPSANTDVAIFNGSTGTSRGLKLSTGTNLNSDAVVIYDAQEATYGAHLFRTRGTNALFIDQSQRVGIGTTSPNAPLEVVGSTNGDQLRINQSGQYYRIGREGSGGLLEFYGAQSGFNGYIFGGVNGERARIDSSGRLGLGTSSPNYQLHVTTDFAVGASGFNQQLTFSNDTIQSLLLGTGYTPLKLNPLGGNVGIGTSSPTESVHTAGALRVTGTQTTAGTGIYLDQTSGVGNVSVYGPDVSTQGTFRVYTATSNGGTGSVKLTVDSSGRVGIGTTSPAAPLDVNGAIYSRSTGVYTDTLTAYGGSSISINAGSSNLNVVVNGSERARIDSSGRLLVGTSSIRNAGNASQSSRSPLYFIEGAGANAYSLFTGILGRADANGPNFTFAKTRSNTLGDNTIVQNGDVLGQFFFAGADGTDLNSIGASIQAEVDGTPGVDDMPGRLVFSTTADGASSPTERMRIQANGRIGFGCTPDGTVGTTGVQTGGAEGWIIAKRADQPCIFVNRDNTDGSIVDIYRSGTLVGTISVTTTATAYNTSSDYRLKENVVPLIGAADRINQLQVHRFNFIADPGKTVDGFLAHEAQAVVPECVTGTKDEVDDDGNPVYQGIDQSKLVPLLTAALQEAIAKIETLEARLTAAGIA